MIEGNVWIKNKNLHGGARLSESEYHSEYMQAVKGESDVNVWQKPLQYCKVISLQLIKIIWGGGRVSRGGSELPEDSQLL